MTSKSRIKSFRGIDRPQYRLRVRYLKPAADQEIVITRHGRPAGVLIGFQTEEDWFEYRLENHPEFLERVASARAAIDGGRGIHLEDVPR